MRDKGQAPDNGSIFTWDRHSGKLNIDSYDYGVRAGLLFKLSDKFSIEANYYYGINNILKIYINNMKWKVQQMTVGLRYKFISIGGQKSKKENK